MFLHLDCRYYLGDRPCEFHRACEGCPHYAPMGPRVLIIKLGALGDVVRTGCVLEGLHATDDPPWVTWVTSRAALPLVERMPGVHRALPFTAETVAHLEYETFDTVLSLDKEPAPCALAMRVEAERKLGMGLSRWGTVHPLNEECQGYFKLGLDNELKFHTNRKTYPELIYEALAMRYTGQSYRLELREEDRAPAARALKADGMGEGGVLVGLVPGAGNVFANKAWREEGYAKLIGELSTRLSGVRVALLGGPEDAGLIERIAKEGAGARILRPPTDLGLGAFAGWIERCSVVVSADTLAMHLAVALGSRSVAIFGPTAEQEIDLFGCGEKVVTPIECSPCYLRTCDKFPTCQDRIPAAMVLEAVMRQLDARRAVPA